MKLLLVASDSPYPPNHGGRVDIWKRMQVFVRQMGFTVDLICTVKRPPDGSELREMGLLARKIIVVNRKRIAGLLSTLPYQLSTRDDLRKLSLTEEYDAVWLESEYVLPILDNPSLKARKVFMRVQNDEVRYFAELARSSRGLRRAFYALESRKFARLSAQWVGRMDGLFFISSEERAAFSERYPAHAPKFHFLPPSVEVEHFKPPRPAKAVLFLGSLFMPNNQEGLVWFFDRVYSHLSRDIPIVVAGNTRGEDTSWLARLIRDKVNVTFIDTPEELEPIYNLASVFINPVISGAGVKIKSIEAIIHGLALVSTTEGVRGTGLVPGLHFALADDPELFALAVVELLSDPARRARMVGEAQRFIAREYNHAEVIQRAFESQRGWL